MCFVSLPAVIRGGDAGLLLENPVEGPVILEADGFGDFEGLVVGGEQQQLGLFDPQAGQILDKALADGLLNMELK